MPPERGSLRRLSLLLLLLQLMVCNVFATVPTTSKFTSSGKMTVGRKREMYKKEKRVNLAGIPWVCFLLPQRSISMVKTLVKIYTIIPIVLLLYVAEACCWHCSHIQILQCSLAFRLPAWEELYIHTVHPLLQYQGSSGKSQWSSLRWFRVKTGLTQSWLSYHEPTVMNARSWAN